MRLKSSNWVEDYWFTSCIKQMNTSFHEELDSNHLRIDSNAISRQSCF